MTAAVDPSNAAQAQSWDGAEGGRWADHADLLERVPARYDAALLDAALLDAALLDPARSPARGAGPRVLDVGCGTGPITRAAARRAPGGTVLGVDLSTAMVDAARERAAAAGLGNVAFLRADAQSHPFPAAAFDVVLSRTGASFFGDPPAAFANLARATAPGGRLALLTWQAPQENEWISTVGGTLLGRPLPTPPPGVPGPFALAEPEVVDALLRGAGFGDVDVAGVREPVLLGSDPVVARDVLAGVLSWMLDGRPADEHDRARAALLDVLRAHRGPDGVTFGSAAWLVTARRAG